MAETAGNDCWQMLVQDKTPYETPLLQYILADVSAGRLAGRARARSLSLYTCTYLCVYTYSYVHGHTQVFVPDGAVAALAAGEAHSLILRDDGGVLACGLNAHGQLGDGTRETRREPAAVCVCVCVCVCV